jgi:hypothetical protein
MKYYKRYLLTTLLMIIAFTMHAQIRKEMSSNALDTNMVVLDENGNALRYC